MKLIDLNTSAVAQGREIAIRVTESAPTLNTRSKFSFFCIVLRLGAKPDSRRAIGHDNCPVILEAVQKESPTSPGEIKVSGFKKPKFYIVFTRLGYYAIFLISLTIADGLQVKQVMASCRDILVPYN